MITYISIAMEYLAEVLTKFIAQNGYWAVFVLMTLESALIPIPSEITMPFAGFLVGLGKLSFWPIVLVGSFANLFGSLLAFALGFWGQEAFVKSLIKKYGRFLLITLHDFERAEEWFRKHGEAVSFFSRLMPVVRTFISLPAGISRMNVIKFSIYTFLGAFLWSAFLTYLGKLLGSNWNTLGTYFRKFDFVIVAVFLAVAILFVVHKIRKIRHESI